MPRVGQNPMKRMQQTYVPEDITVATIVYIPELAGYWAQSLEVLKVCVESLIDSTRLPFNFLVLDNGSCQEVREYLVDLSRQGRIQILLLSSENMGKRGAWNVLFPASPGKYIAYTDSDVLFCPGWLERSLEVMHAFPNVGMVTARPFRTPPARRAELQSAADQYLAEATDIEVRRGNLVDRKILEDFARSTNTDAVWQLARGPHEDILITRNGISAFVDAAHYQFLVPKEVAMRILPFTPDKPVGNDKEWDVRLNKLGKLRLSTKNAFVHHLGNTLSSADLAQFRGSAQRINQDGGLRQDRLTGLVEGGLRRVARVKPIRWAMNEAYLSLFRALH